MTSLLYETAARGKQRDNCDIIFSQGEKQSFFLAGRPLEPVGCLTDEIAIKIKNRDICNISFLKLKCDKQSLRFKLLFNICINLHFNSLMHKEMSRVQFFHAPTYTMFVLLYHYQLHFKTFISNMDIFLMTKQN